MENGTDEAFDQRWNELLKFFRALGGVARNIAPCKTGRGLLPEHPGQPVELNIPGSLIFDVNDLEFAGDQLRLKPSANVMDAQRVFFAKYQNALSWGGHAGRDAAKFIAALDALPEGVRTALREDLECEDLLEGDPAMRAQKQFLRSTSLRRGDADYLVPFADVANHDAGGLACRFASGELTIDGAVKDEIRIAFGVHDPLSAFRTFGVASREPGAFSLPVSVTPRDPEIRIGRDLGRFAQSGAIWAPLMSSGEGHIDLSCLMIGHARVPKLSRGIFRMLLRETGYADPDDAFDRVLAYNWTRYLSLLDALESHQGEMITILRRMARYQLEAMTYCIGSREPGAAAGATSPKVENPPVEQQWQISI